MKKNSIILSTLVSSILFVGCSSNSNNNITVEDGAVVGAVVKDASDQLAKQIENSNVYSFSNTVIYPVTASGGFIDLDEDGVFDEDSEMRLQFPMVSKKGGVITPLTTLIADLDDGDIEQIKEAYNFSHIDDFYKLPSEDDDIKQYTLGVAQKFIDNNSTDIDLSTIKSIAKITKTEKEFIQTLKKDGKIADIKDTDFELKIAHINDTHSHVASESYSLYFNGVKTYVNLGGYGKVVSKIKEIQNNNDNVLTLNAGDTFQGTLYYSLFKGDADADMLNMINWDAIALGNHEFDDGDQHLADYLSKLDTNSSKILAANIEVPSTNPLYNKWSPYTIKTYPNGEKVAIIGIDIVGKTKNSSNPSDEVTFADEVQTAQKYIDELEAQGINKIVLLTHVGLENDKLFVSQLDGVDIVIGGDSHSLMGDFSKVGLIGIENSYPFKTTDINGNKVCIGHAWQYNYAVGNMDVLFDENGVVKSCGGDTTLVVGDTFKQKDDEGNKVEVSDEVHLSILTNIAKNPKIELVKEDAETVAKLKTYSDKVDTKKAEVLGSSSERLGHNRIPGDKKDGVAALPLGSDIAPIVAKSFYDLSNLADACIQNAGGVRVAIEQGDITMGDAYTLLPFANTLFEIKMTGQEIKQVLVDALNESLHGGSDGVISTGAFPYAYGLRYDVYANAEQNSTIANLEILDRATSTWSDIDTTKTYTIVTNSYIAGGKDGYTTFKTVLDGDASKGTDTYLDYAMSFVKYVEAKQKDGESIAKLPASEHPIKSFHQTLKKLGSYDSGEEGGSEISAYDTITKKVFTTNGANNKIDILNIEDPSNPVFVSDIDLSTYGTGVNSVAVSDGKVAVAVEDGDETVGKKQLKGKVVIFDTDGIHIQTVEVGYLPDMVTFNEDGTKIIVANEGEPNGAYTVDPIGSIGIIDVANYSYTDIGFTDAILTDAADGTAVRLGGTPSNDKAKDLEPEYVTVSGNYAYVTLQENNAMAKVDLTNNTLVYVKSYGAKSWEASSGNTIDIEEEGEIKMKSYPGLFGLYQPDSIASYTSSGATYLVTANEGDGREYLYEIDATDEDDCDAKGGDDWDDGKCLVESHNDEKKIKKLDLDASIANAYADENDLKVMVDLGKNSSDEYEKLYTYGARSFAIWDDNGDLVWDSGDEIGRKVAELQPLLFNQDDGEMDGRSGNKGAEPEGVAVGTIDDKTYAFVGLERQNAIMVWDITTPTAPVFKDYIDTGKDSDESPEGMEFISASKSPNGKNILMVSYEMSGTTVFYEVK